MQPKLATPGCTSLPSLVDAAEDASVADAASDGCVSVQAVCVWTGGVCVWTRGVWTRVCVGGGCAAFIGSQHPAKPKGEMGSVAPSGSDSTGQVL